MRPQFLSSSASVAVETLNRWQVGPQLHRGTLTSIHSARAVAGPTDAPWAHVVKRLHGDALDHPAAVEMLVREAVIGNRVRHPHLATVVDAQLEAAPYFIVMPRLPGAALAKTISAAGRLELPMALWIARQAAEALCALHQANWLHSDVKPDNIMVGPDGHATLIDLGFARRLDQSGSAVERAMVAGTCGYIAPEVIRSAAGFDVRSDLYSLGATLYQMLSGQSPYPGRTLAEVAAAQRKMNPLPLEQFAPDLPPTVTELVHELISQEPLRRPGTAHEVVRRLVALEIATLDQQVA